MTTHRAGRAPLDMGLVVGLGALAVTVAVSFLSGIQLAAGFGGTAIVASLLTTVRRTGLVAVLALVAAFVSGFRFDTFGTLDWSLRCGVTLLTGGVAVQAAVVRDRRESRLQRMTIIAETAQRAVLRAMPTAIGSVGLAARYVSASAEALVGGDLYEVAATPFGVRVIVGDVRGKGLEAVQTAAAVLGAFRAAAFTEPDPAALARSIDVTLARMVGDEEFVTAIVGEFHGDMVSLANCGHHPPLLVLPEPTTTVSTVDTGEPTLPLGLGSEPELSHHAWPVGARILFYTDGLVEARDKRGTFFPLDDFSAELAEGTVEEALDRLVEHLLDFGGRVMGDDLALVLAESEPRD
ncbi:PP2C family protein-serine/threonine phosphatase [Nocardioides sp. LS1]|uniref:PP2C family protein-serine/threonine phosphatase n=1 Tax=Nocardioides sp. LS1 TaxID=1027620 RepID=UPI000FFACECC|nr:PP2C family protein-serine/threonine phosphatase [Nocardioides sp. LS1]GCD88273.1 membrane protein [Nocardioides sp. LS1]